MSIRTTHVGSLPRPEALTQLMYAHQEGQDVDLDGAVADAVRDVVEMQVRAGIDVVSDGEMGKPGFVNYVSERLSGFGGQAAPWTIDDLADAPELIISQYGGEAGAHIMPANCEGPVSYVGQALLQRDLDNLRAALDGHDVRRSCPRPRRADRRLLAQPALPRLRRLHRRGRRRDGQEYRAIVDAGFLLQLDCPDIPMAGHTSLVQGPVDAGSEFAGRNVAAIARALEGIDGERVRLHMCWGNYEGPHHLDAPLRRAARPVLAGEAGVLSFEAANPRHEHEWRRWTVRSRTTRC